MYHSRPFVFCFLLSYKHLDLNPGPKVSEATAQSTAPQPLLSTLDILGTRGLGLSIFAVC